MKALFFSVFLFFLFVVPVRSQEAVFDPTLYQAMEWRNIGPYRGGRATTVAGHQSDIFTYYMGTTGGGVWRTTDGGDSWQNISDGFFKTGSVGAIAVSESDPNVIYVGMGESPIRGVTTSHGDGVYKSLDAGKTWTHMGLDRVRQISEVRIHPTNPELVYVAAQGAPYGPNPERGIYRSTDGGTTWELVLFIDEDTGASDLSMDLTNPRILYAGMWNHRRLPWKVLSGGESSGVYKSTDGGDTWEELNNGLPEIMGKIGVAVSPANPERVWALVEADEGGLFRSEDGGSSWTRINEERVLRARAWYYTHLFADPVDEETVYVLNAPMLKSVDGGATFKPVPTPHGDNHGLWINPENNQILINSNDGGANVSYNGGKTWSRQDNQPTAQFYRVNTDNRLDYYVYGGQQDNSSMAIASRSRDAGIGRDDWFPASGCESAYLAFDPDDPRLIYGGCYQGYITVYDTELKSNRPVDAYPSLRLGSDPIDQKYRFNWNAPILVSHHDPSVIYHAGNQLLKTEDGGLSWTELSPDLTRNLEENLGNGGGPITNEAAGAEVYHTIFYIAESQHEPGTIWAGTDDGLVHITRDGGVNWEEVTPEGIGESLVNAIEISPHDPGTAYLAVNNYKFNDFTPHVFKTTDYGQSWSRHVEGIAEEAFVRVVREDPMRPDLLYAGTETGMYVSFNGGEIWQPFQMNLPVVAITDLKIQNNDLVAATQGRSFWILDDLSPLHQLSEEVADKEVHLYKPADAYRINRGGRTEGNLGKNPPSGAILYYTLGEISDSMVVELAILDQAGDTIRTYDSNAPNGSAAAGPMASSMPDHLPKKQGMNRFVWDFRHNELTRIPGVFTFGSLQGYRVPPGTYTAVLSVGDEESRQSFDVLADPFVDLTPADYEEQQTYLSELYDYTDEIHVSVNNMNTVREQVSGFMELVKDRDDGAPIVNAGQGLVEKIDTWKAQIIQEKQKTFQDVINFPNKLNAQFLYMLSAVDGVEPPLTEGERERFEDLVEEWTTLQEEMQEILDIDVPAFNLLYQQQALPAVIIPESKKKQMKPVEGEE